VVGDLLTVFRVAPVDDAVIGRALTLAWRDFEDAVCAAAADAAGCNAIVTRDPRGFADYRWRSWSPRRWWCGSGSRRDDGGGARRDEGVAGLDKLAPRPGQSDLDGAAPWIRW